MVLAVVAILAMIAMPSIQDRLVREQIVEGHEAGRRRQAADRRGLADDAHPARRQRRGRAAGGRSHRRQPGQRSVQRRAAARSTSPSATARTAPLQGKTLTLRPAVVDDAPVVPVAWVCGAASAPRR